MQQELQDPVTAWELREPIAALAFDRSGKHLAFALGDGTLALAAPDASDAPRRIAAHGGAILCMAADGPDAAFVTGGDDGALKRVAADGTVSTVATWKGKWVEHVLCPANGDFRAAAVGRTVQLLARRDAAPVAAPMAVLEHPSTVAGIAVNPKARRLAAAHYNGVSLWWAHGREQKPKVLTWRGSHIGVSWSPDGEFLMTTMQEMDLHGWRLSSGEDMRMSGYPSKVRSLAWSQQPYFLATSGADRVVCWPFSGSGPMGKPPVEIGYARSSPVSAVAAHPKGDWIAAGYGDGVVALGSISTRQAGFLKTPGGGKVDALAFGPDGRRIAFGTEEGLAGVIRVPVT
ncbi:MAG: WD40 repeat domain-containing protein [Alphaproteobacteria bacterium]|nr:WD40 repeat domain-containing protein [Alphaproteobacteria bacterium]